VDLNFVTNNGGSFSVKRDGGDILVTIHLPKNYIALGFGDGLVEMRFEKFVDVVSALIKADRQLHEFVKYEKQPDYGGPFDLPRRCP